MWWGGNKRSLFKNNISHKKILSPPSPSPTDLPQKDKLSARLSQNGASQLPRAPCLGWGLWACQGCGMWMGRAIWLLLGAWAFCPIPWGQGTSSGWAPGRQAGGLAAAASVGCRALGWRGQLVALDETQIQGNVLLNFWLINLFKLNFNTGLLER